MFSTICVKKTAIDEVIENKFMKGLIFLKCCDAAVEGNHLTFKRVNVGQHRHTSCIFYQGSYFYFHSIQKLLVLLGNNDNGWKMAAHGASLPRRQITRQQVTFL